MQTPANPFKKALQERRAQIGLWLNLANPYSTEICAGCPAFKAASTDPVQVLRYE